MDRAVHTSSTKQGLVGRVDDGVDGKRGDVGDDHLDPDSGFGGLLRRHLAAAAGTDAGAKSLQAFAAST